MSCSEIRSDGIEKMNGIYSQLRLMKKKNCVHIKLNVTVRLVHCLSFVGNFASHRRWCKWLSIEMELVCIRDIPVQPCGSI